jgi:hypothetical protein
MKANYFTTAGATPYHPARLIMKLAPAGAVPLTAFRSMTRAAAAAAPAALATRGLSTLARFEKAGLIKKVIPLSRKAEALPREGRFLRWRESLRAFTMRPREIRMLAFRS